MRISSLPPLNGFIGKFLLYASFFELLFNVESFKVALISVFCLVILGTVGALSLFVFVKLYSMIFLGAEREKFPQMRKAVENKDLGAIPALMNRNFDLRSEVCANSISEKNRRMVEIARSCGASAKFTGSGGAIVGTFEDEAMFEKLKKELKFFDVEVIKPHIVTTGEA